ncbi:hypothetical protein M5D96_007961 [Drosophila gunungcola]|uniref:Uncharacterized protein n=1 Tax=Drosophila gunungcola TaxID=103775 RepID=A0A9P9YM31_9MUSC|nr:hypothetical protein M5D96_007961 [Drosophila gunungcola]
MPNDRSSLAIQQYKLRTTSQIAPSNRWFRRWSRPIFNGFEFSAQSAPLALGIWDAISYSRRFRCLSHRRSRSRSGTLRITPIKSPFALHLNFCGIVLIVFVVMAMSAPPYIPNVPPKHTLKCSMANFMAFAANFNCFSGHCCCNVSGLAQSH